MFKAALMACACLVTGSALIAGDVSAQGYRPPRTSFGTPDLSGVWTNSSLTRLERNARYGERLVMTEEEVRALEQDRLSQIELGNRPTDPGLSTEEVNRTCDVRGFSGVGCGYNAGFTDPGDVVMRVGGQPRTSFITTTANGRVPPPKASARAGAAQQAAIAAAIVGESEEDDGPPAAGRAGGAASGRAGPGRAGGAPARGPYDNVEQRGLAERCIMSFGRSTGPVMQPQLYNSNYRFQVGRDAVAIWVEMVHDVRIIRLNSEHRKDGVRPYMGDSIGRWEGNTLVAETTNFPRAQAMNGSWENLKVTERFTRVADDRILYQFSVEDPTIWDAPWGGEYEFAQAAGDIYEYACHEGNYALEGILAGARADEQAAAR